jgi:hypothetical protein
MKKLALFLMLISLPAIARQKAQGYCEQGGKTVTVSSATSVTTWQQSYPACTVTVYDAGTANLSTVFSDNLGTPKGNPFTADANGFWFFYASNARYDVSFSGGGIAVPYTYSDVLLFDNTGATGITTLGAQTGLVQTFANDTNVTMTSAANTHTLGWTGQLAVARGGTGAATFTANGALLGNGAAAVAVTSAGSADQVLRVPGGGGTPDFGALDVSKAAAVTGVLGATNGGTGQSTLVASFDSLAPTSLKGDLIVDNGVNNTRLGVGSNYQVLIADNTQATGVRWGAVNLTTANITGTLPIASGGTGQTGATAAFNALSPLTSKGDLAVHNGTNVARLGVGTNGYIPMADSSQATGIKWTPHLSYGELYEESAGTNITVTTGGTYYQWVSSTAGLTSHITASTTSDNLTVDANYGGTYRVGFSACFTSDHNEVAQFHIFKGGSNTPQISADSKTIIGSEICQTSFGFLTLAAGDTIDLRVTSVTNGTVITIYHVNLSIFRLGD